MSNYKYVILGGGLTAGYAAQEFVENGIDADELCIVSAEGTLPYERPPLSKDFLAGEKTKDDILINERDFYKDNGIVVKLNTRVDRVDFDRKKLFAGDQEITYEKLLIATGSRPRTLDVPGADLDNIFYLRKLEDSREIRRQAKEAGTAVVIGGSFIGMETTSVLQSSGVDTTMIFPEERVWEVFFTAEMSDFFERYYRERGVTILPENKAESFSGEEQVTHVVTSSGERLEADLVVLGIGVSPNTEIFKDTALELKDGAILVNRFLETNLPDVLAAGDVTRYKDVIYNRPLHIEHWDNAVEQGRHAATVMMGQYQPYEHVPYFFSDEFDLSYEFWGRTDGAVETVHRGDVGSGSFSVWWLDEDGRLVAAFVMDRPEDEREMAQEWIREGKRVSARWLQEADNFQAEGVA